jgi:hypothetical protein
VRGNRTAPMIPVARVIRATCETLCDTLDPLRGGHSGSVMRERGHAVRCDEQIGRVVHRSGHHWHDRPVDRRHHVGRQTVPHACPCGIRAPCHPHADAVRSAMVAPTHATRSSGAVSPSSPWVLARCAAIPCPVTCFVAVTPAVRSTQSALGAITDQATISWGTWVG